MTATKEELQAARAKSGLTQKEAARLAGVNLSTWRKWEQGVSPVRDAPLLLFCLLTKQKPPASALPARPKARRKKNAHAG